MKKGKSLSIWLLSMGIILGLSLLYESKRPSCVEAQTCVRIYPQVDYFTSLSRYGPGSTPRWLNNQGCVNRGPFLPGVTITSPCTFQNIPTSNTSQHVAVALTGFHLSYGWPPTYGIDDHWNDGRVRIDTGSIRMTSAPCSAGFQAVRFELQLCLFDNDPNHRHEGQAWFIAYAWP